MKNVSTFGRHEYVGKQGTADRAAHSSPTLGSWGNLAFLGRTWASGKRGLWSDAVGCMGIWRRWVQLRQVFFASRQMFCAQPPTAWKLLRSGGNLMSQPPVGRIHFQISEIYTHQSDDAMCACALRVYMHWVFTCIARPSGTRPPFS